MVKFKKIIRKINSFRKKHEHYLMPLAFMLGFFWDSLTLKRIDLWYENIVLITHLFISGAIIFLLNTLKTTRFKDRAVRVLPFILQFSFGALFSAFFVFYSRSASLAASWPFLLFLIFLMIGNEVFSKRYHRLILHLSIYFIILFSYSIFSLPILIKKMGAGVFVLSGTISLIFISLFIYCLTFVAKKRILNARKPLFFSIAAIYLSFNIFYFTNIIPPIPLSLKEIGVYHSVTHINDQYVLQYEKDRSFFRKITGDIVHWPEGSPVYIYSSVFAPTKINTTIYHRWSYFDEEKEVWITSNLFGFPILGGRGGGYRGYTLKNNLIPGKWRVDVITERNQILGRLKFEIVKTDILPELQNTIR